MNSGAGWAGTAVGVAFLEAFRMDGEGWKEHFLASEKAAARAAAVRESQLQKARMVDALPSQPLGHFVGLYEDVPGRSGPVKVELKDGRLRMAFPGAGALAADLEHWHKDVFRLRATPGVMQWLESNGFGFAYFKAGRAGKMGAARAAFLCTP